MGIIQNKQVWWQLDGSNFVCIIYVSQSHFPFLLIQNVKKKNPKQDLDFRIYAYFEKLVI
jgi:hypothetical protein